MRILTGGLSAAVVVVALGAANLPASSAGTDACVYSDAVSVSGGHATGFKVGRDAFDKIFGSSGITLTITSGRATSVATSLTGSATAGVSAVVAKADLTTSLSLTVSQATTTTAGGSWTVPSTQSTGWLAFGTFSTYSYAWVEAVHTEDCATVKHSGNAVSPVAGQHFGYTHS
jgi:hypothetical protein